MVLRGALIVFEGCDRAGKTTQCKLLVNSLLAMGHKVEYISFPTRNTETGKIINDFLREAKTMEVQEAKHLFFTLNRWELKKRMEKLLNNGTTLIVDRYSYSGVAYSVANGLSMDWCKAPESGLIKPDKVFLLKIPIEELALRAGFGDEVYDIPEFQRKVMTNFEVLKEKYWIDINANKSQTELADEILNETLIVLEKERSVELEKLW